MGHWGRVVDRRGAIERAQGLRGVRVANGATAPEEMSARIAEARLIGRYDITDLELAFGEREVSGVGSVSSGITGGIGVAVRRQWDYKYGCWT